MVEMEKSRQETDKIRFNIDSISIQYWFDIDLIWKWKFSKKYWFKTDFDIIFIFTFRIKSVLIRYISFCNHFISTNRHNTDILVFHNLKPIKYSLYHFSTDSTFVISLLNRLNSKNFDLLLIFLWYW